MPNTGPRSESFASQVLRTFQSLSTEGDAVRVADVAVVLDMVSDKDKRPLYRVVSDLKRAGKLGHDGPGMYRPTTDSAPEDSLAERMWRAVRLSRKRGHAITVDDLVRLVGVGRDYAREFLRALERREIVSRTKVNLPDGGRADTFRMIADPVEMPELAENADKLRKLRAKKRDEIGAALNAAEISIRMARRALEELDRCGSSKS